MASAPTGVTVVQGKGWLEVTWLAPAHPDSALEAYDVYVGQAPGAEGATPVNGGSLVFGTTYTVTRLQVGPTYYVTVRAFTGDGLSPPSNEVRAAPVPNPPSGTGLSGPVVSMAALPDGSGYWLVDARGDVSPHGTAVSYPPGAGVTLGAPVVQIVSSADGLGYWEVAADGQVAGFGDAAVYGSVVAPDTDPIVGMARTPDGRGYWLVALDGAVYPFGDAPNLGSATGTTASNGSPPIVGIALDRNTGGYWLVATDGEVFGFDAPTYGSLAGQAPGAPVIGVDSSPSGLGYWLVTEAGGVTAFGDAVFAGSAPPAGTGFVPTVALVGDPATGGYWLAAADGGVVGHAAPDLASP